MSVSNINVMKRQVNGSGVPPEGTDATALRAAAQQHLKAANALGGFDGVALPQVLSAALSMELYLKAFAIHTGAVATAKATGQWDNLSQGLQQLPTQLRSALTAAFSRHHGASLEGQLGKFNKAYALIRHHHQMPDFYEGFDLSEFMQLARFFGEVEPLS